MKKLISAEKRCCERVWDKGAWSSHQCFNPGKVIVEGKQYCNIHDPIKAKERSDLRYKIYSDRIDRKIQQQNHAAHCVKCHKDLVKALEDCVELIRAENIPENVWEILKKAKGGA